MKSADTCILEQKIVSILDALELRDRSSESLYFICISCREPVKAHRAGNGSSAHFEHYERNYSCPHSEGKGPKNEFFSLDDKRAIEGYQLDRQILSGSRNHELANQCKIRDGYTCKACGFKLKYNGRYIIECHHKNPIGGGGIRETSLEDLICLCPTCHRIAHTRNEPLNVDEISLARKSL